MSFTLNDYFDKILCINLDIRQDRWAECTELFNKHNLNVERLPAVLGKNLNILSRPEEGVWYSGYVGCGISHLFAVKYAKQLNLKNVLILEDDVDFAENINQQFEEIKDELPSDWSMLYFGGSHYSKPVQETEHLWKTENTLTSHAVAINSNCFDDVIQSITNINMPVDVNYRIIQRSHKAYVTNPHLAWQRKGYSDVNEMEVDYSHMMQFFYYDNMES